MSLTRRSLLGWTSAALASVASGEGLAQSYPSGPVRLLVGFPPGGPVDIAARLIGPWLESRLGQPFEIVNRPGDSGNVATREVVRAQTDGRSLLVCGPVNTINTTLFDTLDFVFERDLVAVGTLYAVPLLIHVRPSLGVGTLAELIARAKAAPGTLKVAFAGVGTPQHIGIELFKRAASVDLALVPYLGSAPAIAAVMAGEADAMFDPLPSSIAPARAGRLRALAVTGAARSPLLPDVPTAAENVPGYEAGSWFGLCAPSGTAPEIVAQLGRTIGAGLSDPGIAARIADVGGVPTPRTPAEAAAFINAESARYATLIKATGITRN
ncbi:MAG: tripartite tricarboxylate transporter substrate binding protein [Methylocystis sp.]|nr:tripartite tricarboxylate transporter substrate binding protein [Methylocystis sp.]MCA3582780.1 tripartite tricarboxylate transporter substrate binding protein [Methylocystis sp.]MCA3588496.1 tripartite tricarboxylate transporter substrate binding protein [Methylocystis sp.]MCA3592077.1 tripartite tricarboxylate transporter substrate binding protein [Methylocystis sp.]